MYKFLLVAVVACLGLAACAQPRDSVPIVVTHEGGRPVDVADSRARDDGCSRCERLKDDLTGAGSGSNSGTSGAAGSGGSAPR